MARTVTLDKKTGRLVSAAQSEMVKRIRQEEIRRARTYQHAPTNFRSITFLEACTSHTYWDNAAYPEDWARMYQPEKVVIEREDPELGFGIAGIEVTVALVILRWPTQERHHVVRLKVKICDHIASNGNNYKTTIEVDDYKEQSKEDREIQDALTEQLISA